MYLIGGLGYAGGRMLSSEQRIRAAVNVVSPGYFPTMEVPVLSGRDFGPLDRADGPKVAIVNETLARQLFPEGSALGRRIGSNDRDTAEIVGIVKDTLYAGLIADVRGILYSPLTQRAPSQVTFLLRYSGAVTPIIEGARARLREVDSSLPMYRVNTLNQEAEDSIVRERLLANASSLFGVIALLVAGVGLYGALSLAVARRNREIAIRMALGANQQGVIWMVLRESLTPVTVGGLIGLPAGYLMMRFARTLLFGVEANDPATMAGAAVVLLAVAAIAAYLPARRAARVEPMSALRAE
jgi:predicted permease